MYILCSARPAQPLHRRRGAAPRLRRGGLIWGHHPQLRLLRLVTGLFWVLFPGLTPAGSGSVRHH